MFTYNVSLPNTHAGFLLMRGVSNPASHAGLDAQKEALEEALRVKYQGQDRKSLEALPVIAAYSAFYKQFKKTYHVLAQVESIAFKGRSIPSVAALVEAMFMAEVKNLLLTAGHDFDQLQPPITIAVADGSERYITLRGEEQQLKPGDMHMADREGVISSIIYGPDQRTMIGPETKNVLFAIYAPTGIPVELLRAHLEDIEQYVQVISPQAMTEIMQTIP